MSKKNFYEQIELELKDYQPLMEAVLETILDEEVSKYPIFIAHQAAELSMGVPIVHHTDTDGNWTIHASTLEEFVTKQIVATNKLEYFKEVFKPPSTHVCVFYIGEGEQQFLFLPRTSPA